MKPFAKTIIAITIFLAGIYIGQLYFKAPCVFNEEPVVTETGQVVEEKISTSLMLDFGNGDISTFNNVTLNKNASVFDLLQEVMKKNNVELKYKDYGGDLGVMIEGIGEVVNDFDNDRWWQYWVNNEYAKVGASGQVLNNGDVVEWKFVKGQLDN